MVSTSSIQLWHSEIKPLAPPLNLYGRQTHQSKRPSSHRLRQLHIFFVSSRYAVREGTSKIKIFKNFKEKKAFKPDLGAEGKANGILKNNGFIISTGIFGGALLGVKASNTLSFYDWESLELIRRIEVAVKHVSNSRERVREGNDW